uniref:EF-hand domain-containing protein n=1 Tax=Caenorhabditis japonica TaxID=281687 RepID=A0A8R1HK32_CAEJA
MVNLVKEATNSKLHNFSNFFLPEFNEFHGYEEDDTNPHDENVHDVEGTEDEETESPNNFVSSAASKLFSMTKDEVKSHLKDIIRGFSDKGVEECDQNNDGFLDESEILCFITEKMGYSATTTPSYVVHHYDRDQNGKLDKDGAVNIKN